MSQERNNLTWDVLARLADGHHGSAICCADTGDARLTCKHKDAEAILRAVEHEIYRLFQG